MEQQTHVPDSVLEKIQKLMALRDNPGTPAEGAAAAAMITNLLMKHNLDLAMVENHKIKDDDVIDITLDLNEYQGRHDAGFGSKLISAICYFNFCRPIHTGRSRKNYDQGDMIIMGQKHNVEIVKYMVDYCNNHIVIMEKDHWRRYEAENRFGDKRNTYRRAFYEGAVQAICRRLMAQQKEAEKEAVEEKAKQSNASVESVQQTMSLMVVKNTEAVDKAVEKRFPNLRAGNARRNLKGTDGRADGRRAGERLDLVKGLNTSEPVRGQIR